MMLNVSVTVSTNGVAHPVQHERLVAPLLDGIDRGCVEKFHGPQHLHRLHGSIGRNDRLEDHRPGDLGHDRDLGIDGLDAAQQFRRVDLTTDPHWLLRYGTTGGGGGGGGGSASTRPPTMPPSVPPATPPSTPPSTPNASSEPANAGLGPDLRRRLNRRGVRIRRGWLAAAWPRAHAPPPWEGVAEEAAEARPGWRRTPSSSAPLAACPSPPSAARRIAADSISAVHGHRQQLRRDRLPVEWVPRWTRDEIEHMPLRRWRTLAVRDRCPISARGRPALPACRRPRTRAAGSSP